MYLFILVHLLRGTNTEGSFLSRKLQQLKHLDATSGSVGGEEFLLHVKEIGDNKCAKK